MAAVPVTEKTESNSGPIMTQLENQNVNRRLSSMDLKSKNLRQSEK